MTDISVQNIIKAFEEDNDILKGLTFEVTEGEHVGLLGRNGAGKTTLFRLIEGEITPDEGEIVIPAGKRVGILSQIPHYPAGYTAEDVLKTAHNRIYAMQAEMEELQARMAEDHSPALMQAYDRVSAAFEAADGYELDRARNTVANGLAIPQRLREQLFDSLSGGEKTRINLARLILEKTDILLLDEPTNHLDMRAAEWLEDYLCHFKGTVLVISHDRWFLDRVVTRTIEIVDGKAEFYSGNYSFYIQEKQRRYEEALKQYEKDQAKIRQLQEAADKLHLWAFMGNDKLHKRAFSMEKRIERLNETERPTQEQKIRARFSENIFRGDDVMVIKNLTKSFGERVLFHDVDLMVTPRERIALIGDNGTGKSTLLKLITDEQRPDRGMIRLGPAVKTAYLPQIIHFEDPYRSVLDTMIYEENYTPQTARNRLGAFHFRGEEVYRPVSQLSGGEQSRLRLCMLMKEDVNLLILDEPTNHLDILAREWVEDTVADYSEALLFVSHDRYFINKFATRIWELEDGVIRDFRGTFEEYRAFKARQAELATREKAAVREAAPKAPAQQKKKSGVSPARRLERLEQQIAGMEEKLSELDAAIEEHSTDYEQLMTLTQQRSEQQAQLDELYEQWEVLANDLES